MDTTKFDAVLDMNDPNFATKLREAMGLPEGAKIQIMTPQFTRTDGLVVPLPTVDFLKLRELSEETLKAIGCQQWSDDPNAEGEVLWLFPGEWYAHIPENTPITDINGEHELFKPGETDDDIRFGALAYGFMRKM